MLSPKRMNCGYPVESVVDDWAARKAFGGGSSSVWRSKLGEDDISNPVLALSSTSVVGLGLWLILSEIGGYLVMARYNVTALNRLRGWSQLSKGNMASSLFAIQCGMLIESMRTRKSGGRVSPPDTKAMMAMRLLQLSSSPRSPEHILCQLARKLRQCRSIPGRYGR